MNPVGVILAGSLVVGAALAGMKVPSPAEAVGVANRTDEFVRAMVLPTPFELQLQRLIVDANRALYEQTRAIVRNSFALHDEARTSAALDRAFAVEGDVAWWPVFRLWCERDVKLRPFATAVVNLGAIGDAVPYMNLIADDPSAMFVRALQEARFDDARAALADIESPAIEVGDEPAIVRMLENQAIARERLDAALRRLERDRRRLDIDARIDVLDTATQSGAFDGFDAALLDLAMSLLDRDLTDAQLGRVLSVIVHNLRGAFVRKAPEIERSLTFAAAALLARSDDVAAREAAWIDVLHRLSADRETDLEGALALVVERVGPGVHEDARPARLLTARADRRRVKR